MASLFDLPDEKKNIIWVLTFGKDDAQHKTGFAVTDSGHIMTTAHFFELFELGALIKARRLDQETVSIAELVEIRPKWNLAIFKVNKITPFGVFHSSGNLAANQSLLYIGHPGMEVGCCLFGRVSFPCLDKVTLPTDGDTLTCKVHKSNETPTYRVLGHVYNSVYNYKSEVNVGSTREFMKHLHPQIPIIQANGFCWKDAFKGKFGGMGLEGGPIFDSKGEVVGMMFTEEGGCQLAIHVSLLKYFMRLCNLTCP